MKSVIICGRGGQGVVTLGSMIVAAAILENKYAQSMPTFGFERRGRPVHAYLKIDDKPIREFCRASVADYVLVLDSNLLDNMVVTSGLKRESTLIINTIQLPADISSTLRMSADIATVDATGIALKTLRVPITNTAMMGAFSKASHQLITINSVCAAIDNQFSGRIAKQNKEAARMGYDSTFVSIGKV